MAIRSELSKKNKYWISKHRFLELYHFCLQYPEWRDEYLILAENALKSPQISDMPKTSNNKNTVEQTSMRMLELKRKMQLVEETASEVGDGLEKYIIKAVTNEDISFNYLKTKLDIPCGKDFYYDKRRKFFFLLDKKLKKIA